MGIISAGAKSTGALTAGGLGLGFYHLFKPKNTEQDDMIMEASYKDFLDTQKT